MKAGAIFTLAGLLTTMALVGTCHARQAFIVWGTGEGGPGTGGATDSAGDHLAGTRALGPVDLGNGALVQLWKAVNDVDDPRDQSEPSADPNWCIDDELLDEAHVGYGLLPPGSPGDGEFSRATGVDIEVGDVLYVRIYDVPKPDLGGPLPEGCEVGISTARTVTDAFTTTHPGRRYYFDNMDTEPLIAPPCIPTLVATPGVLWPPNHKMVEVTVTVDPEGLCDPVPVCRIVDVSSNEPLNDLGDGNTESDWEITGDLTVKLRAERAGVAVGRVYTIHVECTDDWGNTTTTTVEVIVPHDQGNGKK